MSFSDYQPMTLTKSLDCVKGISKLEICIELYIKIPVCHFLPLFWFQINLLTIFVPNHSSVFPLSLAIQNGVQNLQALNEVLCIV